MRKIIFIISFAFLFIGCETEKSDLLPSGQSNQPNPPGNEQPTKVGEVTFTISQDNTYTTMSNQSFVGEGDPNNILEIFGQTDQDDYENDRQITIFFPVGSGVGAHALTQGDGANLGVAVEFYSGDEQIRFDSMIDGSSGELIVTAHDRESNTIQGTFSFESYKKTATFDSETFSTDKSIVNGTFEVVYTDSDNLD